MQKNGFHHVAFACRDLDATVAFYQGLLEFPLVHTEMQGNAEGFLRHVFFDLGDGSSLAFFYLQGIGEPKDYPTAISTDLGLPILVNHVAFRADQARYDQVKETMTAQLIKPVMEADHGWCRSVYYADPNGILIEFCVDSPGFKPDPKAAMDLLHAVPEGYTK